MIDILTPNSVLCSEEHSKPFIIFPEDFKSFEDLLKVKDLIRDLKLVPIKSDEMQLYYHSFTKEELLKTIQFDENSNFLFIKNSFPYILPEDVEQYLIWIKEDTDQEQVIKFIEEKCLELNTKDIILFERPFGIKTKLVKPSFPFIRHIHFWYKKL